MTDIRRLLLNAIATLLALGSGSQAAEPVEFAGALAQGALVIGKVAAGTKVSIDGRDVRVSPEGRFLLAFDRDAKTTATLGIRRADGGADTQTLRIAARQWQVQKIDGLPQQQVAPDPAALKRIQAESALIAKARGIDTAAAYFVSGFTLPVSGRTSGVYGSQRVLNGEPRSPHRGLDIAAAEGTPVVACADGIVLLVHADMFFTGRTVMIDHGHGLKSTYAHLSAITVTEGQPVAKGEPIGRVGASGRATGPHLHWGVSVLDTYVDPEALATPPGG